MTNDESAERRRRDEVSGSSNSALGHSFVIRNSSFDLRHSPQDRARNRTGGRVLIDDQGNIVESKVQALLRQRDNRPVTLKESCIAAAGSSG